jgi:hypothetical protein
LTPAVRTKQEVSAVVPFAGTTAFLLTAAALALRTEGNTERKEMTSKKVMINARIASILILLIFPATNSFAEFSTNGYAFSELYSSSGTYTTIGGLDLDGGQLYFGNYNEVKSIDLSDNSVLTVGDIGSNAGNALVARHNGLTFTAFGTSYNEPYPYKMGYIDESGNYVNQLDEDGIYDVAVNPQGDCYIAVNPGALGTKIFSYDWDTGATSLVADIGGYSGGLAFDSIGNLYYADQGYESRDASILMFTAAEIAAGGLGIGDADSVLGITAGYIGFDEYGALYATTGYGSALSKYDIDTQLLVNEIAYGNIGKFLFDGDNIYTIDTDWGDYSSTIQMITVPEPATIVLMCLAGLLVRRRNA